MSVLPDVKTHPQLVVHGLDRAPAGAPTILFATLSGAGPDAGKQTGRQGRFTGQQGPLRLSLQHGTSTTATVLPKSTCFSSPLAMLTAVSLPWMHEHEHGAG